MVVRCVMPFAKFDQMDMLRFAHFVIHLPVNLLQIFCRPVHLSCPVDIAVKLHVLQLSFSFLQRPCWKFCICGLCWPVCERTLWTLYWYVRVRMSCVMIFFKMQWLSACIQVRCDYITIHYLWIGCDTTECLLYIWRRVSCLMGSHVGPRAGCGCCMPCEVVACIVVLPMPVDILLVFLCLFEVDIYFLGFVAILLHFAQLLNLCSSSFEFFMDL